MEKIKIQNIQFQLQNFQKQILNLQIILKLMIMKLLLIKRKLIKEQKKSQKTKKILKKMKILFQKMETQYLLTIKPQQMEKILRVMKEKILNQNLVKTYLLRVLTNNQLVLKKTKKKKYKLNYQKTFLKKKSQIKMLNLYVKYYLLKILKKFLLTTSLLKIQEQKI